MDRGREVTGENRGAGARPGTRGLDAEPVGEAEGTAGAAVSGAPGRRGRLRRSRRGRARRVAHLHIRRAGTTRAGVEAGEAVLVEFGRGRQALGVVLGEAGR